MPKQPGEQPIDEGADKRPINLDYKDPEEKGSKELAALEAALAGRAAQSMFKPQLTAALSLHQVVQGKQAEVKATLDKAKKSSEPDLLLKTVKAKNIVTDYSGRAFKEAPLTLFQAAYYYEDRHMMDLLRGSKLFLLSLEENETLPEQLKQQARENKTPILMRRGKEYSIYGFDQAREAKSEKDKWEETPVNRTTEVDKLLEALPFVRGSLKDSVEYLTPSLRELLKQGHLPLEQYISEEEIAEQLADLRDNKIKYSLPLVSLPEALPIDEVDSAVFRSLSIQNKNKPLLIKQGEELRLYGYDFKKETWKLMTPSKPELFRNLPFPNISKMNRSGVFVRESFDQISGLPEGNNLAFVLIQEKSGMRPKQLYRVDRSEEPPKIEAVIFPINQNVDTFTRALYPRAKDEDYEVYKDIAELNNGQVQRLIQVTGSPVNVAEAAQLTEEQYEELAHYHTQGTEHGLHYDARRLEEALQTCVVNDKDWDLDQFMDYWLKWVREAQKQVAVHVGNEYCRLDRSFATVPKYESEMILPRELSFYSYQTGEMDEWFPLVLGSGLSSQMAEIAAIRSALAKMGLRSLMAKMDADHPPQMAIMRGGMEGGATGWEARRVMGLSWTCTLELAAMHRLSEVCTKYVVDLKESLPRLELAPGTPTPR